MAIVYAARQTSMNRDVALKIVDADQTGAAEIVRRFKREVQINAILSHPHILKVFDYGQQDSLIYLVMEYIAGGSLSNLISQQPMELRTASQLLDQIASALDYVHELGIIHRDIKPQNILVDKRGNAFLSDFGISVELIAQTDDTPDGLVVGTPSYMAPEDWHGLPPTPQSDIYSLGILLYEMLVGTKPFSGGSNTEILNQHLTETPPSVLLSRPELPEAVNAVVMKALAKNPQNRYRSAGALAAAFKTTLSEQILPLSMPALVWGDTPPLAAPLVSGLTTPLPPPADPTSPSRLVRQVQRRSTAPFLRNVAIGIAVLLIGIAAVGFLSVGRTSDATPGPTTTIRNSTIPATSAIVAATRATQQVPTSTSPPLNLTAMPIFQTQPGLPTAANAMPPGATPIPVVLTSTQPKIVTSSSTISTPVPPVDVTNLQIAFTSDRNAGINAIFVSEGSGNNLRELTPNTSNNYGPVWSKDSWFIAFTSYRDGNAEVYVMDSDGGNQHNLTRNPNEDFDPAWSPDGRSIAFVSNRTGNRDIYVMNADGGKVRDLTNNAAMDWFPAWSPDGAHIAFTSNRSGDFDVYVMNADGSNVRNLTKNPADDRFAAWSPDSAQIAFNTNRDGNFEVYVMQANGDNAHNLTNAPADDLFASWTPDGRALAFASNRNGSQAVFVMDADGGNQRKLTDDPHNNFYPAWRP